MAIKKGNKRIVITLREKDIKFLDKLKIEFGCKTYGKVIRLLFNYFEN